MIQQRTLFLFIANCGGLKLHHHSINDHHQCLYNHCRLRHDHQEIFGAATHHCSCMNLSSRVPAKLLVSRGTCTNNQMNQILLLNSPTAFITLLMIMSPRFPTVCCHHTMLTTPCGDIFAKQPLLGLLMYSIKSST